MCSKLIAIRSYTIYDPKKDRAKYLHLKLKYGLEIKIGAQLH